MRQREEDRNRANVLRWFHEVWAERNEATIDLMLSDKVRAYGITDEPLNKEGFKAAWRGLLEAFPDFEVTVDDVVCEGPKTAARHTCSGTHLGAGLGVPPTGKKIVFTAQTMSIWEDDKIIDSRNTLDMAAVYRQITE